MAVERITLPAARKLKGLTQKDLALLCGVSESTVLNWEKYRTEPSVTQAKTIANAVGVQLDDLIFLPTDTV